MSDLVAIAVRLLPWEAYILRGRLEAENIFATLIGEQAGPGNGNVQVLVREEDAARALEIKLNGGKG